MIAAGNKKGRLTVVGSLGRGRSKTEYPAGSLSSLYFCPVEKVVCKMSVERFVGVQLNNI